MVINKSELARKIYGAHFLACKFFPEVAHPIILVSSEEADQLADAVVSVAKYYDFAEVLDNKWIALGNLAFVVTMVYGQKFIALSALSRALRIQAEAMTPAKAAGLETMQ